ncbi:MAG: hypothetical protein JW893_08395 [Candidatus Omnitrophica bacterium]|nr:hypothetical protein [Candidatus Omnitrophota bacterium]
MTNKTQPLPSKPIFLYGLGLVLAVKAIIFIAGSLAYQIIWNNPINTVSKFFLIWNRWDAIEYVRLASAGYEIIFQQTPWDLGFPPLLPWMTKAVSFLFGGNCIYGSFFVSGIASLVAGYFLIKLVQLDEPDDVARRSLWFMLIFPTSYFLHIGYTESLFLACLLPAFLAARKRFWLGAGCLGALMACTRMNGLLIISALAAEAYLEFRETKKWNWTWLYIFIPILGFGAYLWLNHHLTGDFFAFLDFKKDKWYQEITWPWVGIKTHIQSLAWRNPNESQMIVYQEFFFIGLGLVMTAISFLKMRLSYSIWMLTNMVLFISTAFVISVPRYVLVLFPIYILFAKLKPEGILARTITIWGILMLGLFITLFVDGRWAF